MKNMWPLQGTRPQVTPTTPIASRPLTAPSGAWAYESARQRMVAYLQETGIHNPYVLQAFAQVPRHQFVATALAKQSYEDTSLPIGHEQTISKPSVIALMMQLLDDSGLVRQGRVLDIGTGCGYQAVLLKCMAREVYSIERISALHTLAKHNISRMFIKDLHLLLGDGFAGFAKGAPYAGIISAAAPPHLPQAWVDQLAVGARLVTPIQVSPQRQVLLVVDKHAQGIRQQEIEDVRFVALKSGRA